MLKVCKKSVAYDWKEKDQRPTLLLWGYILNALTDVIKLLPFNEFQCALPWINYLLSSVLFFSAGFSDLTNNSVTMGNYKTERQQYP